MLGSTARLEQNHSGFMVPASILALPLKKNPVLGNNIGTNLWSTAPQRTYVESLKQLIQSYTKDSWLSIGQVSEAANTSIRTMQRQLSAQQTSYSILIQEVRAEMAGDLLETTDFTIRDIAHQLGYRHQGDFTHAFYRWAKVSPSEFRKHRSLTT